MQLSLTPAAAVPSTGAATVGRRSTLKKKNEGERNTRFVQITPHQVQETKFSCAHVRLRIPL